MSTWLYLECRDHNPPVRSDDVGQHLGDLRHIRKLIANRECLLRIVKELDEFDGMDIEVYDHGARNALWFLREHPTCRIGIRDEYGEEHPTKEPA